jgi:broad specificity phosphatase PhoE
LNAAGLSQVSHLTQRLASQPVEMIFSSDLSRTRDTAAQIAVFHAAPITIDPRLREINFGEWEGRYYIEIAENDAIRFQVWRKHDSLQSGPPGGERVDQVVERLQSFLNDLTSQAFEHVLIVTHGGSGSLLLCLLLDITPTRFWQFRMSQAGLSEIELRDNHARLNYFNDTCHL